MVLENCGAAGLSPLVSTIEPGATTPSEGNLDGFRSSEEVDSTTTNWMENCSEGMTNDEGNLTACESGSLGDTTIRRNILLSVFGEARPAVIFFECVVTGSKERYSGRLVAAPKLRFYYFHSSGIHHYNCVINTLDRNGGVSVRNGDWGNPKWSLRWDSNSKAEVLKKMHALQKTNHFPGSFQMGWKDSLYVNIERLQRRLESGVKSIIPRTYNLPKEFHRWNADRIRARCGRTMWIFKPRSSSCGRGIQLVKSKMSGATLKKIAKKNGIIQKYISNPLLLNGFKCDLRLYVLTLSVDPLKIYLFDEGLVRIATLPYVNKGRSKSRFMHLTNYSVNKKNCIFVKNEDMHFFGDGSLGEFSDRGSARSECAPSVASTNMSHKWSLRELQQNLMECGLDYDKMIKDVEDVIIKVSAWQCWLSSAELRKESMYEMHSKRWEFPKIS